MNKKAILSAVSVGILIGLSLAAIIVITKINAHGKFPGSTHVAGIDLSYKDPLEAQKLLTSAKESYFKKPIKIFFGKNFKLFKPEEIGLSISVEETLQTLNKVDAKNKNVFQLLFQRDRNEKNLPLVVVLDHTALENVLEQSFDLANLEPKSANFYFDENSKLAISDSTSGIVWDKQALAKEIKTLAQELKPMEISLQTEKREPNINKTQLEKDQEAVKNMLRHEFILMDPVYSDDWKLKLTDHLDWVVFKEKHKAAVPYFNTTTILHSPIENLETQSFVAIEIDQEKLNKFVDEKISKWLDRPATPVNIYKNPEGKIIIEGQGDNGIMVHRPGLKMAIELAVANQIKDVPIPVVEIQPQIKIADELQDLGIKERLAIGHTSYYGSPPNRIHNIKVGAERFNGLLIAPNEIFSFNKTLGPVDAANGYKKELVIKKEGTLPDFGGGICQVSTTMFRAALFAGLPEIKRNQHSYAVSYYSQILGHGLDATIFLGGPDLKFKNDTGHHILIQTYTEKDYEIYIVFYGTKDGRKVEMEGPYISNNRSPGPTQYLETTDLNPGEKKQVEKSHTGFDALWYRHLTLPSGEKIKETISTKYKAIPAKILIGVEKIE